jgi:hypothetical protein
MHQIIILTLLYLLIGCFFGRYCYLHLKQSKEWTSSWDSYLVLTMMVTFWGLIIACITVRKVLRDY